MRISTLFRRRFHLVLACTWVSAGMLTAQADPININGHPTLVKGLHDNSSALKDAGLEIKVEGSRGATSAIAAIGEQQADIAVMSRSMTSAEKAKYPTRRFFEYIVAAQAYVPAVARNVWESGVKTITKQQMQKIFEGEYYDWSSLGGGAGEIKFFQPEPGSPAHDLLTTWLYDDPRKAPEGSGEVIRGSGKATRDTVEFTRGSIAMLPPALADGKEIFALGVVDDKGKTIQALEDNLLDRSYPISRPVFFTYSDRPVRQPRMLLDFLRKPEGKVVLISADLTPVNAKDQ